MYKLLKYFIRTTSLFLLLSGIAFIYCVYRGDQAMPKSGLGNVENFVYWDNYAVIAKNLFMVFIVFLVIEVIAKIIIDIKKL
jgi:hypothetical protein